jgi:hypothetical protein
LLFFLSQEDAKECCPADELMKYVSQNNLAEVKKALKFQPKFVQHTIQVKENIAKVYNSTIDQITFIGVHNRRTVSI